MTESDPAALAAFIGNQRAEHHVPHRLACRVLGVSESWFYKWRGKPMTTREVRRGKLAEAIKQICLCSRFVAAEGFPVGELGVLVEVTSPPHQVGSRIQDCLVDAGADARIPVSG
ncbi:hypothetical protein OG298_00365 [Streptomyces sp. NBC_01005]|nr:hypothetical protein [Streptomyces sp. NBC_01362]WSW02951.1 hypothetical protein OG298_00365 [Streptomyces sp. NBC_01005]WTC92457.1 hypothetical protein OH736_00360 [Streptomyces sp. NBC_01650]